jgi:hypothetical protein
MATTFWLASAVENGHRYVAVRQLFIRFSKRLYRQALHVCPRTGAALASVRLDPMSWLSTQISNLRTSKQQLEAPGKAREPTYITRYGKSMVSSIENQLLGSARFG